MKKYADRFKDITDVEDVPAEPCFYDPIRPVYVSKKRALDRDQDCIQNLIDQNGVSTRVFVKDHGVDFVRRFFHGVFFGV